LGTKPLFVVIKAIIIIMTTTKKQKKQERVLIRAGGMRCMLLEATEMILGMAKRGVVTPSKLIDS